MKISKPLKWHGGKHYLADRIIELMPPHTHYVEPYAGGLSVLFAKPAELIEGYSEVVNDLNGGLTNFWRVLADEKDFEHLVRLLEATPVSEVRFKESLNFTELIGVYWAADFFVRYRQSRQGLGKDFATLSRNRTRRGMNEQASSWLSAIEGLPESHERLKRVVVLNRDAIDVIRQQDGPNTFFYLDPPYLHETRVTTDDYEYEMNEDEHEALLDTLGHVKGRFILSGYRSDLYDRVANYYGWHRNDIEIDNKASSKKTKDKKTECLWMNFVPSTDNQRGDNDFIA